MNHSTALKYLLAGAVLTAISSYITFGTELSVSVKATASVTTLALLLVMSFRIALFTRADVARRDAQGKPFPPEPMPTWGVVILAIGTVAVHWIVASLLRDSFWFGLFVTALGVTVWVLMTGLMYNFLKKQDPISMTLETSWKHSLYTVGGLTLLFAVYIPAFDMLLTLIGVEDATDAGANTFLPWLTASSLHTLVRRRKARRVLKAEPL